MKRLTSLLAALWLCVAAPAGAAENAQDFSAAERLLFMSKQLANVRPPATLAYRLRKSGSFEAGFEDSVAVQLERQPDGTCCAAKTVFLSGARQLQMPDLAAAEGNPVILYFLEHDVRDMQRLTKGAQNYYRKRIRMAIYAGAAVREVQVPYRGQSITASEVRFSPYADDPNRARFEKFARKEYRFLLSDAVPGGVYGVRTRIDDAAREAAPLMIEELWIDGADPAALQLPS